jgi:two-component system, cell cycle response regulator DivK
VRSSRRGSSVTHGTVERASRVGSGARAKFVPPVVLIVDDTEDNLELFAAVLCRDGWPVVTARDGAEALEIAAAVLPTIVVMDLAMPRMDGFEAVRLLRQEEHGRATYVIVVSAFSDAATRARAKEAGADEFLAKPCPPAVLAERVRAVIEARRETPQTA